MSRITKAVIMARGLGTRMKKPDESAVLNSEQAIVADAGMKAMIPIGRPFLDYVLSGLADAGYTRVCLVIGPEHSLIRDYYLRQAPPQRLRIQFALQEEPRGTADAVRAAEQFVGGELFLVINSDNYYPSEVLRALGTLDHGGVALFDRDRLVAESNIPADRVLKFAVAKVDGNGYLDRIYEKPDEKTLRALGLPILVSMNSWILPPAIFEACRAIQPSSRGELELTDAVRYSMEVLGQRYRALIFHSAVLDLSCRSDIAAVADRLSDISPNP